MEDLALKHHEEKNSFYPLSRKSKAKIFERKWKLLELYLLLYLQLRLPDVEQASFSPKHTERCNVQSKSDKFIRTKRYRSVIFLQAWRSLLVARNIRTLS